MGGVVHASSDHIGWRIVKFSLNLSADLPDNCGVFGNQVGGWRRCGTVVSFDLHRRFNISLLDYRRQQFRLGLSGLPGGGV